MIGVYALTNTIHIEKNTLIAWGLRLNLDSTKIGDKSIFNSECHEITYGID